MKITYTTSCSTESLADIRGFVSKHLANLALSELEKSQVILAVDEACANAIIHGNACDKQRELHLSMEIDPSALQVEITDIGTPPPFTSAPTSPLNIAEFICQKRKGGLGQRLIYHFMDNVDYFVRGNQFVCSLQKQLKGL